MNFKSINSPVLEDSPRQDSRCEESTQETPVWEPPFERWMQLADDLLRKWPHPKALTRENRI